MHSGFNIDLPPYLYLKQVIDHYPTSAGTYIELWRHKDKKHKLVIAKNQIRNQFLCAPTKFRNDLYNLVREGLVNIDEKWDKDNKDWWELTIELVSFEEE